MEATHKNLRFCKIGLVFKYLHFCYSKIRVSATNSMYLLTRSNSMCSSPTICNSSSSSPSMCSNSNRLNMVLPISSIYSRWSRSWSSRCCYNSNSSSSSNRWTRVRLSSRSKMTMREGEYMYKPFGNESIIILKTVDTIGNCQRPVFSLGVSQHA